jgi:hypothetical protein
MLEGSGLSERRGRHKKKRPDSRSATDLSGTTARSRRTPRSDLNLSNSPHIQPQCGSKSGIPAKIKTCEPFSDSDSIDSFYSYSARVDPIMENRSRDENPAGTHSIPFSAAPDIPSDYQDIEEFSVVNPGTRASPSISDSQSFRTSSLLSSEVFANQKSSPRRLNCWDEPHLLTDRSAVNAKRDTTTCQDISSFHRDAAVQTTPLISRFDTCSVCQFCGAPMISRELGRTDDNFKSPILDPSHIHATRL